MLILRKAVGWAATLLVAGVLVLANPWFALVVVPALLVAVGVRVPVVASARQLSAPPVLDKVVVVGMLVLVLGGAVVAIAASDEAPPLDPGEVLPRPPAIELPGTYAGTFTCTRSCEAWAGGHALTVTLADHLAEGPLAEAVPRELADDGWELTRTTIVDNGVRLHFEQLSSAQPTGVQYWPLRATSTLSLPRPAPNGRLASLPPGPEAEELAGPLGRQARQLGLDIYLGPGTSSTVILHYPRLAVSATSPESVARDTTGGRQERELPVRDDELSLDLLSPLARTDAAATLVATAHRGWAWFGLVVVAVGALLGKEMSGAFVGWLKRRLGRLWRSRARRPDPAPRDQSPFEAPASPPVSDPAQPAR